MARIPVPSSLKRLWWRIFPGYLNQVQNDIAMYRLTALEEQVRKMEKRINQLEAEKEGLSIYENHQN